MEGDSDSVCRQLRLKDMHTPHDSGRKPQFFQTKKSSLNVQQVKFNRVVNPEICASLVVGFIKHIMARRGFLPLSYGHLQAAYFKKFLQTERQKGKENSVSSEECSGLHKNGWNKHLQYQMQKEQEKQAQYMGNFEELFTTLNKMIIGDITEDHAVSNEKSPQSTSVASQTGSKVNLDESSQRDECGCDTCRYCVIGVREVLVLFGSSPITPKESYLLNIPSFSEQSSVQTPPAKSYASSCTSAFLRTILKAEFLDEGSLSVPSSNLMVFVLAPRCACKYLGSFRPYLSFRPPKAPLFCTVKVGRGLSEGGAGCMYGCGEEDQEDILANLSGIGPLLLSEDIQTAVTHAHPPAPSRLDERKYFSVEDRLTVSSCDPLGTRGAVLRGSGSGSTKCDSTGSDSEEELERESDLVWYRAPVYLPGLKNL